MTALRAVPENRQTTDDARQSVGIPSCDGTYTCACPVHEAERAWLVERRVQARRPFPTKRAA